MRWLITRAGFTADERLRFDRDEPEAVRVILRAFFARLEHHILHSPEATALLDARSAFRAAAVGSSVDEVVDDVRAGQEALFALPASNQGLHSGTTPGTPYQRIAQCPRIQVRKSLRRGWAPPATSSTTGS